METQKVVKISVEMPKRYIFLPHIFILCRRFCDHQKAGNKSNKIVFCKFQYIQVQSRNMAKRHKFIRICVSLINVERGVQQMTRRMDENEHIMLNNNPTQVPSLNISLILCLQNTHPLYKLVCYDYGTKTKCIVYLTLLKCFTLQQ